MKNALALCLALLASEAARAADAKTDAAKRPQDSAPFKVHPCEQDAIAKAGKLIRLHFAEDSNTTEINNLYIDEKVVKMAPLKAPGGKGKLDVLEVNASIYKGDYRMRFIYVQGHCTLMGQEILSMSNPY